MRSLLYNIICDYLMMWRRNHIESALIQHLLLPACKIKLVLHWSVRLAAIIFWFFKYSELYLDKQCKVIEFMIIRNTLFWSNLILYFWHNKLKGVGSVRNWLACGRKRCIHRLGLTQSFTRNQYCKVTWSKWDTKIIFTTFCVF